MNPVCGKCGKALDRPGGPLITDPCRCGTVLAPSELPDPDLSWNMLFRKTLPANLRAVFDLARMNDYDACEKLGTSAAFVRWARGVIERRFNEYQLAKATVGRSA
jgi:hypothetical protein